MEPLTASPTTPDPDATEFVRYCYRRRRVGWPELYDEMCAVASRGLFRGLGPDDLAGLGIGFSLFDMPALAGLAATVVAEEQARRRPVAVAILAEVPGSPIAAQEPVPATAAAAQASEPEVGVRIDVAVVSEARSDEPAAPDRSSERSVDVPIRLAAATAGA